MSWRVVNQHQTTTLTAAGTFEDVMEITAVSNSTSTPVTIRVPLTHYTEDNVKKQLDARFDAVHAVHNLSGD